MRMAAGLVVAELERRSQRRNGGFVRLADQIQMRLRSPFPGGTARPRSIAVGKIANPFGEIECAHGILSCDVDFAPTHTLAGNESAAISCPRFCRHARLCDDPSDGHGFRRDAMAAIAIQGTSI